MVEPPASHFGSRLRCALVVLPAVHTQADGSKATALALLLAHPRDTL
jgi:hypothetical protein